ncbi:MAG: helix-turn-helix domain-containing protein [Cytophagales bacterium]|nr:helix-turn-helix domain-containing protein [Cytophagales bacterium]
MLILLARLYPAENQAAKTSKGRLLVKRFKQSLEEKYQLHWTPSDYAELLAVTPSHLTETIKDLTGKTTGELIQEKIILETKRLLLHTEKSASEIAFDLGFKDQSYFTRFFRRCTGSTPQAFRQLAIKST